MADWIILGELAYEVALDLPADQATRYYRISRDAYEKAALAIQPDQPQPERRPCNSPRTTKPIPGTSRRRETGRRRPIWRPAAATWPKRNTHPQLPLYGAPLAPLTAVPGPRHPSSTTATDPADQGAPRRQLRSCRGAWSAPRAEGCRCHRRKRPRRGDHAGPCGRDGHRELRDAAILLVPVLNLPTVLCGVPYTYQQFNSQYYPSGVADAPARCRSRRNAITSNCLPTLTQHSPPATSALESNRRAEAGVRAPGLGIEIKTMRGTLRGLVGNLDDRTRVTRPPPPREHAPRGGRERGVRTRGGRGRDASAPEGQAATRLPRGPGGSSGSGGRVRRRAGRPG